MFTTLLFLAAALAPATSQRYMSDEEKQDMLDAHNVYRRKAVEESGASDMRMMEWDDDLEKFAYSLVQKCELKHSGDERHNVGGEGSTGENIMWSSASNILNSSIAVKMWYDEIVSYNYDTLQCNDVCGHYTQVVWSKSFKVGCAATSEAQCTTGSFVFCNYAPSGNYQGEKPFQKGDPCSGCEGDWTNCIDKLCSRTNTQGSADQTTTGVASQSDGDTGTETMPVSNLKQEVYVTQTTTQPAVIVQNNQATRVQAAIPTTSTVHLVLVRVRKTTTVDTINTTSDKEKKPSTSTAQGATRCMMMNLLLTLTFCTLAAYV